MDIKEIKLWSQLDPNSTLQAEMFDFDGLGLHLRGVYEPNTGIFFIKVLEYSK